ncbi:hypothetical protein GCM10027167_64900 [Nocardia heshunensis]
MFSVVQRADRGQAMLGAPGQEPVQELQEPGMQPGEFGVAVAVRIGLEVDVRALPAHAGIDIDEQIVDQPRGQHV